MTIIVEDGAGKSDAQSYCSVAFADAYFQVRNVPAWAALTTEVKESSLVKATDFMEATYSSVWKGAKATAEQALAWPRTGVVIDGFDFSSSDIPMRLKNACAELAYRATTSNLIEDQGQRVVKEKVDVIETTYADYSDPATRYPIVNRMIAPLVSTGVSDGGFQTVRLVRV